MHCRISVIIPTYKPKDYLWECLNSLKVQTLPKEEFEVILVLNGCCQPWMSRIDNYLINNGKEININFIQTDIPGVSNARNIGLDKAKGEYISFIDDDDYVSPFYLQGLLSKAAPNIIALAYPYAFIDGNINQTPYSITDTYERFSSLGPQHYTRARKYFSGPCMKLIPVGIIKDRRYNTKYRNGEDGLFMFLISNRFGNVDFANKNCIYYRRFREGSAIFSQNFKGRFVNSLHLMWEYFMIFIRGKHYHFGFLITRELGAIRTIITR